MLDLFHVDPSLMQTCMVGVVVFLVILWLAKRSGKHGNLPPGPSPLPLIGNLLQLRDSCPFRQFDKWSKTYGPVLTVYLGPKMVVVVNNIEAALEVLVKRSADFANRPTLASIDVISDEGRSIAFGQYGPIWKIHRKLSSKALRQYLKGEELERRIHGPLHQALERMGQEEGPYDPTLHVTLIVCNVFCGMVFGESYKLDDPDFKYLVQRMDEVNDLIADGFFWEDFIPGLRRYPTKKFKTLASQLTETMDLFNKKYEEHKATFDKENIRDFTDFLILARHEALEEEDVDTLNLLTDRHLIQTLMDIFFGGIDTTRFTLRSVILYMVAHPDVQLKVQEELDSVLDKDELPRIEHRPRLPYTEAVIHEVMRTVTILPLGLPHRTTCDTKILNFDIPEGTDVFINHWALHNDSDKWTDVNSFRPERFLNADGQLGPKPESWLPFSAGRRVCLGESVAKPELHLIIAALMHRFTWRMPDGVNPDLNLVENFVSCFPKAQEYVTQHRH